jgi:dimethylargininase
MSWKFSRALVRPPADSFAMGLTTADEGPPDLARARAQHAAYCAALQRAGVQVHFMAPDDAHPDSTFVEDTAILTEKVAIATLPGAASRVGEVATVLATLVSLDLEVEEIVAPGSVDGGDICQAEDHFFIGLSQRTNDEGARQLAEILRSRGYTCSAISIRRSRTLLHLKSGIAYLGDGRLLLTADFPAVPEFAGFTTLRVVPEENYAANCVRVNDRVLIAAGYPRLAEQLEALGLATVALDVSEFRKMDGGLSCLSLRF